jgi:hypothetical protein
MALGAPWYCDVMSRGTGGYVAVTAVWTSYSAHRMVSIRSVPRAGGRAVAYGVVGAYTASAGLIPSVVSCDVVSMSMAESAVLSRVHASCVHAA